MMFYSGINKMDVVNGEGIRVSLFVSGCTNCCKGCFNSETWNFCYGNLFTSETLDSIIKALEPNYIKGFSLLGGDPFELQNQEECSRILIKIKDIYPTKDIWCWTGYTLKDLRKNGKRYTQYTKTMLDNINYLVEGKFELNKKDASLKFRGSANQLILYNNGKKYIDVTDNY